jgi:hypothetical protein
MLLDIPLKRTGAGQYHFERSNCYHSSIQQLLLVSTLRKLLGRPLQSCRPLVALWQWSSKPPPTRRGSGLSVGKAEVGSRLDPSSLQGAKALHTLTHRVSAIRWING